MQDCFREHPDVYGSEVDDDEEEDHDGSSTDATSAPGASSSSTPSSQSPDVEALPSGNDEAAKTTRAKAASKQVHEQHKPESETEGLVPKAWHDGNTPSIEGK
jgi:intermembrane space import and assembly protein 40